MKWLDAVVTFFAILSVLIFSLIGFIYIRNEVFLVIRLDGSKWNATDINNNRTAPDDNNEYVRRLENKLVESFRSVEFEVPGQSLFESNVSLHRDDMNIPVSVNVTSTNVFLSNIQLDMFSITLDATVEINKTTNDSTTFYEKYELYGIEAQLFLTKDLNETLFTTLQQTSYLSAKDIFPCLLFVAYDTHVECPLIRIASVETIVAPWWQSIDTEVTYLASTSFRDMLHAAMVSFISDAHYCPHIIAGEQFVDFRDLFLSSLESLALGGSGTEPYGPVGQILFDWLRTNNNINSFFTTIAQSDVAGTIRFPDIRLWTSQNNATSLKNLQWTNITIANLDTLVAPTTLFNPTNQPYVLNNQLYFGVHGRPLTFSVTLLATAQVPKTVGRRGQRIRQTKQYQYDFNFTIDALEIFTTISTLVPATALMEFPMKDILNLFCWLSLVSAPTQDDDDSFDSDNSSTQWVVVKAFRSRMVGLILEVQCPNCESFVISEALQSLTNALRDTAAINTWSNQIANVAKEIVLSNEFQSIVKDVVAKSRNRCLQKTESDDATPIELPWFSSEGLETLVSTAFVALESSILIDAQLLFETQNLRNDEDGDDDDNDDEDDNFDDLLSHQSSFQIPNETSLVNFTDLEESSLFSNLLTKGTRNWLGQRSVNKFLPLKDNVFFFSPENMDVTTWGLKIKFNQIQIEPFNSFTYFDIFDPIAPQTFLNQFKWDEMSVLLNLTVEYVGIPNAPLEVDVTVGLEDINATVVFFLAVKKQDFRSIQFGSLLNSDALSCLLSAVYEINFPSLRVAVSDFKPNVVGLGPDIDNLVTQALFDMTPKQKNDMIRLFVDNAVLPMLNEFLVAVIGESECPNPITEKTYVDFREAFNSSWSSSIYGDLVRTLKNILDSDILGRNETTGLSKINNLVDQRTKLQSGEAGAVFFPEWEYGVRNINPWGLIGGNTDRLEFRIYNFSFENLSSANTTEVLKPNGTGPFLTNNRWSIGAGGSPFRIGFSLLFASEGLIIPVTNNTVEIEMKFENIEVFTVIKALIREKELLAFPLRDVSNGACWAQLMTTNAGPGTEPLLDLNYIDLTFSSIRFNMNCLNCASQALQEISSLLDKLENVSHVLIKRLAMSLIEVFDKLLDIGVLDTILIKASRGCSQEASQEKRLNTSSLVIPPISSDTIETMFLWGDAALQIGQFLVVDFHANYDLSNRDPLYSQQQLNAKPDVKLIDISRNPGVVVDFLHWASKTLSHTILYSDSGEGDMFINGLLRSLLVGKPKSIMIEKEVGIDTWRLMVSQLILRGLDTFTKLNLFNATSAQTFQSKFGWKSLEIELELIGETVGQNFTDVQKFTISLALKDIDVSFSLFLALDEDKLGEFKLGSVLEIDNILPCLFNRMHAIEVSELYATAENIGVIEVKGFRSQDAKNASDELYNVIKGLYNATEYQYNGSKDQYNDTILRKALPAIMDVTLRSAINQALPVLFGSNAECPVVLSGTENSGFIDFRDLLLPKPESRFYGGSGLAPYGNLFEKLLCLFDQIKKMDSKAGGLNDLLLGSLQHFQYTSTAPTSGSLSFPGSQINISRHFMFIPELDAKVELEFSDIAIENIATLGAVKLFMPTRNAPHQLNNTIPIGFGGKPLGIKFRFKFSFRLGDNNPISNEFCIQADFYDLTFILDIFTQISETKLLEFPFRSYNNIHCWLAILQPPASQLTMPTLSPTSSSIATSTSDSSLGDLHLTSGSLANSPTDEPTLFPKSFAADSPTPAPKPHFMSPPTAGQRASSSASTLDFDRRVSITHLAMHAEKVVLNFSCHNCTSPSSDEATDFVNFLFENFLPTIGRELAQDLIDNTLTNAARLCSSIPDERGQGDQNQRRPQKKSISEKTDLYIIIRVVFLLFAAVTGSVIYVRIVVSKRNRELTRDPFPKLQQQQRRRELRERAQSEEECMLNNTLIPTFVRRLAPVLLLGNMVLCFCGLYCSAFTIIMNVRIGGATLGTDLYENSLGGVIIGLMKAEDKQIVLFATLLCILSIIWPYLVQIVTLTLWFLPPRSMRTSFRDSVFLWLNILAKWSLVHQMVVIVILVVSRISLSSRPQNLFFVYSAELKIVFLWGFYANLIVQLLSQIIVNVSMYYHSKIFHQVTRVRDYDCKEKILSVYRFSLPHQIIYQYEDEGDVPKWVVIREINVMVAFGLVLLCALIVMGCMLPSFSLKTSGLVGIVQAAGRESHVAVDVYNLFGVMHSLMEGQVPESARFYVGVPFVCLLLLITILASPLLLASMLLYMWLSPMTVARRKSMLNFIEMLQSWEYNDIFLFAVMVQAWQIDNVSNALFGTLCENLDNLLGESECFRRQVVFEHGFYCLFVSVFLSHFLKKFVTVAAKQYVWESDELDLWFSPEQHRGVDEPPDTNVKISPFPVLFTDSFQWVLCRYEEWYTYDHFEISQVWDEFNYGDRLNYGHRLNYGDREG